MFGVVPRVLWERVCPPDEMNRIRMNMNCVFIDTGRDKILIETGIGEKWTQKQTTIYGIERERPFAESLREIAGCTPEDITIVINTHLHFDHAGGNTILDAESNAAPQFPNARYLVSKRELAHADSPHERDRASYLPDNWQPLRDSGQLEAMPDDYEAIPGLRVMTERGHSETMQVWRLDSGGRTLFGFADLIPMKHHVPLPYIAGFDLYPVETLEFKKRILPQAVQEDWLCLFYHDIDTPLCRLSEVDGKLYCEPTEG
ncbi:MAG: Zn-dependent hydrolase-like glyoxylase [Acidobacteria bacterium OLB17]|nr:MAG: Zn-dependent hydrolase-like glyoxylase [Acidobacteria bacterium OLB17]